MSEAKTSNYSLYKQYWKQDFLAAVSVSLIALPLAIGIAIASGAPPISGLIAAIIGGVVTTFIRSSHVAINGPAASLIVAILTGNQLLADADGGGFQYVLAAICVAGAMQVIIGAFKLGRLAEIVPNSVVEGMLAAIGIIIFAKQVHIGLGQTSSADSAMGTLLEIPKSMLSLDPKITLITAVSLFIMIIYPKIKSKLFHFVPAPVWVLIFAIPFVFLYQHIAIDILSITDVALLIPDSQLIDLPEHLIGSWSGPNFSKINTGAFWLVTISIMIIASIETLISTKAIDSHDPLQRKTNLNKDLMAIGLSTTLSGFLGGLPIITVIVRSSVNIQNNARTRLSNFFHGVILLIFLLVLKPVVEEIPLAALAAILIYTGYKLASPKQFIEALDKGEDQLFVMSFTVLCVLIYGILWGIALGMLMAFVAQWIKSRMTMKAFILATFSPRLSGVQHESEYELKLSGVFNFLNLLKLKRAIKKIPSSERAVINLEEAVLIDFSVMEYLGNMGASYEKKGGQWLVRGLDNHDSGSSHPNSMRMLQPQHQHSPRWMTEHQRSMMKFAARHGCQFHIGKEYDYDHLKGFAFFKNHPVEYVHNTSTGLLPGHNLYFTGQDIVFDEGALMGKIAYDTTVVIVELQTPIAPFVLEREQLYDKLLQRAGIEDINFEDDAEFSTKELLISTDVAGAKKLFNADLRAFILANSAYHIESCENRILVFLKTEQLTLEEMNGMLSFTTNLISKLNPIGSDESPSPEE